MVEIQYKKYDNGNPYNEIYIDGKPVEMGEGIAELLETDCKIHGKQKSIWGSTQCGHDGMDICVECCREIIAHLDKTK